MTSLQIAKYSINFINHIIIKIAKLPFHLRSYFTDTAAKSTLIYQLSTVITFFSHDKEFSKEGKMFMMINYND